MSTRQYAHLTAGVNKDSERPVTKATTRITFDRASDSVGAEGAAILWLSVNGEEAAYVSYDAVFSSGRLSIRITYIKSFQTSKGYARALMEKLYHDFPDSVVIDWGVCHHDHALALAEDFYARHFSRTLYEAPPF